MIHIARSRTTSIGYKNLTISVLKEKYLYFILGGLIIAALVIWGLSALTKQLSPTLSSQKSKAESTVLEKLSSEKKSYKVKQGDNLWKIAENTYGSGYNFVDIVKANNIANPNIILVGQVIALPQVAAKASTKIQPTKTPSVKATFKGDKYTVKQGDHLWKISLEAYGDAYAWTKIAATNKLKNPDLIFPNTKLTIPR
ncbi:hypothetical protein A3C98_03630 [Candidatus Roizmanbacteria bacterium RIFCSPHIGHO2_02_FULL_37_15]|uniref:LysM domain-containing protein n=1 Tax=Candidatus Roizmanbacteria bacterium RIFCSPLOWO2_01_FULL_37_16 TaxID=1802058 RepID=A0A1F7INZ4_9BACT|nr:MAG: hypothetical protein A2859_05100 [Candidatus Roizmanbacteria bacterium RIFCSPHIGHO2_01_FULL_37_16b]OGK20460.1 MAG: hypothetical protein A3C98_03630 [Candidatus Roizmanbacteria bacterium RIFCSPHIGHO2_02_FULL_37_15]OGK31727.1 MAG: hypothetical protein A3F57_00040 [Candidatus Roizmanbacteria bacterium RIFCSPHIGHO2_12_FULL_36_11]OGK45098.1 MAG: hypothetical protein A3B40_05695 [Candidatus Roizmanbacteria bacterium RIFCSPLOWO2_01_FULL_37_16]OGK55816.1 MAG: hypothetical protein A3I50_03270 [C